MIVAFSFLDFIDRFVHPAELVERKGYLIRHLAISLFVNLHCRSKKFEGAVVILYLESHEGRFYQQFGYHRMSFTIQFLGTDYSHSKTVDRFTQLFIADIKPGQTSKNVYFVVGAGIGDSYLVQLVEQ